MANQGFGTWGQGQRDGNNFSRPSSLCRRSSRGQRMLHVQAKVPTFAQLLPIVVFVLLGISNTCSASVLDRRKVERRTNIADRQVPTQQLGDLLPREDRRTGIVPRQADLPRAFDGALGSNFTSPSCPAFFNKFLTDQNFVNCVPLSLLLLTSQDFFDDQTDADTLDQVLDASCSVVGTNCNNLMQSYAGQLKDPSNCGDDFDKQQPSVLRAYQGLVAYLPIYQAGCLKLDPNSTSSSSKASADIDYCLTNSLNASNEADNSLYYIPLGVPLPNNSRPTCSSCTQQTMSYFAAAAGNMSTPLGQEYSATAAAVNQGCGPSFVNASVQPLPGTGGASGVSATSIQMALWSLVGLAGLYSLLL